MSTDAQLSKPRAWAVPFMYALLEYGKFDNEEGRKVCVRILRFMEEGEWDSAYFAISPLGHIDADRAAIYAAISVRSPATYAPDFPKNAIYLALKAGVPKHILDALSAMYLA